MNIALTIICALVFIYGLFGRVPKFFADMGWKPIWRIYWVLVAIAAIVVVWVLELSPTLYWILIGIATSWLTIPVAAAVIYFIGLTLYEGGKFFGLAILVLFALIGALLVELFKLLFGAVIDRHDIRRCEKILASDQATEAEKVCAKDRLKDLSRRYNTNYKPSIDDFIKELTAQIDKTTKTQE